MRILVCIKQICVSGIKFQEGDQWVTVKRGGTYAISRFDAHALEAAIQIKEAYNALLDCGASGNFSVPAASVDVLSMGPERVAESIRRAMGMGADRGIHLITDEWDGEDEKCFGYVPGGVTAGLIADFLRDPSPEFLEYIQYTEGMQGKEKEDSEKTTAYAGKRIPYDLILTGIMSEDLMQAQVGPMVAAYLGIPCIISVVDIRHPWGAQQEVSVAKTGDPMGEEMMGVREGIDLMVHRELEGGVRQEVSARFPMLLTLQAGINQPRYPTFSNLFKAKKRPLFSYPLHDVIRKREGRGPGRSTAVANLNLIRLEHPQKKREGRVLEGTIHEKADQLMGILKRKGLI